MTRVLMVGALLFAACASAKDDAPPRPAQEIVTGAGRIKGGNIRMDVTIGHAFKQKPAKGGGKAIKQGTVTP